MYTRAELKSAPELKRVVLAAFPSYRKLRCTFSAFQGEENINSYWDGGTKDEFAIVELSTMQRRALPSKTHPFYEVARYGMANKENEVIRTDHVGNIYLKLLPAGFALVKAGTFCGKPATAHIFFNPDNLAKYLAAPSEPKESIDDARERAEFQKKVNPRGNCGECLMAHVDVVPLNVDGTCSCCATEHKLANATNKSNA